MASKQLLSLEEGRQERGESQVSRSGKISKKKTTLRAHCIVAGIISSIFITLTVIAFLLIQVTELSRTVNKLTERLNAVEDIVHKKNLGNDVYGIVQEYDDVFPKDEDEEPDDEDDDEDYFIIDDEAIDVDTDVVSSGDYDFMDHRRVKRRTKNRNRETASGETATENANHHGKKKKGGVCKFKVNIKKKRFAPMAKRGKEDFCMAALENTIRDIMKKESALNAIHLPASIRLSEHDKRHLANNPNDPLPVQNGEMYDQGYITTNDTLSLWSPANWTKENEKTSEAYTFHENQGAVEILQSGLFYVYAQVTFHETQGHVGYHVVTTKAGQRKMLFTCLTGVDVFKAADDTTPVTEVNDLARYRTCPTGGIVKLLEGEQLSLVTYDKISKIDPNDQSTFWGVIQLAVDSDS